MNGFVYWITGPPGSGKTTKAKEIDGILLDGDEVRKWLTPDCDFSDKGRQQNVLRVAKVAKLLADAGETVVVALVSPIKKDREKAFDIIGRDRLKVIQLSGGRKMWPGTEYEP